jgi:hypothetical protein
MRSKFIYILLVLALPVLFISCETEGSKSETITIEPTVENVQDGAQIVMGTTLDLTADAIAGYDERAEAEENGTLNKPTANVTYEDGWWIWENVVSFGDFEGTFTRKCQFKTSANGQVVMWPSQSDYMTAEVTAFGTFGFPDGEPYGTTFDHKINVTVNELRTNVRVVTGSAHISKVNNCLYNDEDATLEYTVDVNLDRLTWVKTRRGEKVTINGDMTIDMNPWHADITCDATTAHPYAHVVVKNADEIVKEFDYDLNNFRHQGLINGNPKF